MITISGGVILKQSELNITYELNCDRCGNAESFETKANITRGVTEVTTKKCSKCGNNQIIKMKHMIE